MGGDEEEIDIWQGEEGRRPKKKKKKKQKLGPMKQRSGQ